MTIRRAKLIITAVVFRNTDRPALSDYDIARNLRVTCVRGKSSVMRVKERVLFILFMAFPPQYAEKRRMSFTCMHEGIVVPKYQD